MLRRLLFNFRYFRRPPWDSGVVPPELAALLGSLPPGRALDLGCGTGTSSIALALAGWQVTGVDYAWRAVKTARRKAGRAGVSVDFRNGDVTRLEDIPGPFDLALDIGCFHSLTPADRETYLARLSSLLAPGGRWFLYAFLQPAPAAPPGIGPHDLERILKRFGLLSRQDGRDGRRESAYFLFRKTA